MSEILDLMYILVIVLAFYVQGQAYYRPLVKAFGVQSTIIAVISFYFFLTTGIIDYIILGLILIAIRGVVTPLVLLKVLGGKYGEREKISGVASLLIVDMAFFFVAVLVIFIVAITKIFPNDLDLLFSFSLFFQGLFLIASRRSTPSQILGYLEEENAIVLLGISLIPIPLLIEVSIFLDVLGLVVISSVIILEKKEHLPIDELKG
ncbi:hydrogenase [Acidianus sp. RZ1]|uniref:hydrogenase n=1 Tax=Acidianus sp. RZ1 TaxID=1540082 RepID=UPI001492DA09|nr:hydrogenase [Acidianus sp. RZ1]NON62672.1 hydrogenase [Acidianus sp. RZ1]